MGISPLELATTLLDQQLADYDDFTWNNGDPRTDRRPPPILKAPAAGTRCDPSSWP